MWADGISHPLLVPRSFVHSIVMATAGSHRHFVELWIEQNSTCRVLPTGRGSIDADSRQIHLWILGSRRLDPKNAIREACILDILPTYIMKSFRSVGRSHSIDLYNNESQPRQRFVTHARTERFRYIRALRASIDVFNNRILFGWIKVFRTTDDSPNIGHSISSF